MKKLKQVLIMLFTMSSVLSAVSQDHNAKSPEIKIDAKGGIYNHDGTKLGYIDKNDIVRNNKDQKLYFIDKDGNVIDANGKSLGKAKKNGVYINANGETILTVKDLDAEKCAILDPKGHNLGTTHKNYKLHACAAHCFFLEQEKKKTGK